VAQLHHGRIENGNIVLREASTLPEGSEVVVTIEPIPQPRQRETLNLSEEFAKLPFFGMYADREDMRESTTWVHQERLKWHQRDLP
jgi:hypothetical protein